MFTEKRRVQKSVFGVLPTEERKGGNNKDIHILTFEKQTNKNTGRINKKLKSSRLPRAEMSRRERWPGASSIH